MIISITNKNGNTLANYHPKETRKCKREILLDAMIDNVNLMLVDSMEFIKIPYKEAFQLNVKMKYDFEDLIVYQSS